MERISFFFHFFLTSSDEFRVIVLYYKYLLSGVCIRSLLLHSAFCLAGMLQKKTKKMERGTEAQKVEFENLVRISGRFQVLHL